MRDDQKDGQLSMFGPPPGRSAPEGFRYQAELLTEVEERALLAEVETLPFRDFEFQGYVGKRRVVSFGWKYDFNARTLDRVDDMPPFLLPLRERAATFAGIAPEALQHALVTEYGPGAGIGWHKDKAVFGDVVGVSLLSRCQFRLRRQAGEQWERYTLRAERRSVYLLRGPSRTEWEHSIPEVGERRYSVTFRNLREG